MVFFSSSKLRVWYINGDGVISQSKALQDVSQIHQISLACQLDVLNNLKIPFKINWNDYIGDLKAVTRDLRSRKYYNTDLVKRQENEDDYLFKYIVNGQRFTQSMDFRLISVSQIKETHIIHVTIICLTNRQNSSLSGSSSSISSNCSNDSLIENKKTTT